MPTEERPVVRTLTEAKALAALANPVRSRIMDALRADGPSTASALAERMERAVGSVSHHLKVLHEAGLIEEAPELARDRRERWWRLVTLGSSWSRTDFAGDTAALTASRAAEALVLQRQFERSRDWITNADQPSEWAVAAFVSQHWMRMSPAELGELAEEVIAVMLRWSRREIPDDGVDRETVFAFARVFPAQP